jgi:hypothetical protein
MEDRSRGERYLVLTCLALIQGAGRVKGGLCVTAARALVSLRPSELEEVVLARLFRGKLPLKLDQTHGFLLHCDSSFLLIFTMHYTIFAELRL